MAVKTQVNTDSVQTLSNKTMTTPLVNGGTCGADPTAPLGIATKQFVEATLSLVFPTGIMSPYGGSVAPAGFLLCDGTAISRSTFSALFSICGTTYGAGNGSTTFNLPDKRGRSSIGSGTGSGLTARTRGAKIGTENETAPLPAHTHTYTAPGSVAFNSAGGGQPIVQSLAGGSVTGSAGTGGTHNNMQPSEVDTWIIKT